MLAHPPEMFGVLSMALLLGLKHGLDPDHLAVIDSLARCDRARRSRWSGVLFSLGHGAVVMLVAAIVAAGSIQAALPDWLDPLGAAISITFLFVLGLVNAKAALFPDGSHAVAPRGLRAPLFVALTRTGHPVIIAATGALFALSFDTLSQAVMFSVTAQRHAGWPHALSAAAVFTLGMLIADGFNGVCIARLLRGTDRQAAIASRILTGTIALLSIGIAANTFWRFSSPTHSGSELGVMPGLCLIGTTLIAIVVLRNRVTGASGQRTNRLRSG